MRQLTTRLPFHAIRRPITPQTSRFLRFPSEAPSLLPRCGLSSSPILYKKEKKSKIPVRESKSPRLDDSIDDPGDHVQLRTRNAETLLRFQEDLSKLRAGGRFNTASLEELKVHVKKDSRDTVRLSDLAQVVPKGGRMVTVLAAEEEVSLNVAFWFFLPALLTLLFAPAQSISDPSLQQSSLRISH